jgi:membrane-associated protease RseP (regulator of RpoE activity)
LWSGNWEEDSSSAQDELAERRVTPRDSETPASPPAQANTTEPATSTLRATQAPRPPRARAKPRRSAWIALGAVVLVAAAGAVVLTSLSGSSKPRTPIAPLPPAPSLAATTPTTTAPPASSGPPVSWLGMELETVQPGGATVETVRLGSEGDHAGLSPGDVILEINGRSVSGADGIARAIQDLHAGDRVAMQISHGSSLFQTVVTLGASPTRYP